MRGRNGNADDKRHQKSAQPCLVVGGSSLLGDIEGLCCAE